MPFARAAFAFLAMLLAHAGAPAQVVSTLSMPTGSGAWEMALNPSTNRVYVPGDGANVVTEIDGNTNATTQIAVGRRPQYVAVNVTTNRVYASNVDDGTLSVIDGATRAVASLPIGGAGPIVVNERTNKVYVIRLGNNGEVTVIDGATHNWYTIDTGSHTPHRHVVDADANRLYVTHRASGDVRAIDASSTSDHPPTVSIQVAGMPALVAINRATRKVYATSDDTRGPVVEIDPSTLAATPITLPGHAPFSVDIVANPVTNRIYLSLQSEVAVIDGATRTVSYIPTGSVGRLAVDSVRNRVYGAAGNRIVAIDGATQQFSYIGLPSATAVSRILVNEATNRIYAAGIDAVVVDASAFPPTAPSYGVNVQGMWWNPFESGWGVFMAHQGNTVFATWFTYDLDGNPLWLVVPNAARTSEREYRGDVYRTTGPAYNAAAFDPAAVRSSVVGNVTISVQDDPNRALLSGTVLGTFIHKGIDRQVYGSPVPACTTGGTPGAQPVYQDMWWRSSESGWGLSLAHQGDIIFAVLYQYDEGGKASWLVASNVSRTGNGTYSGTLYRTWGPPYDTQFYSAARVSVMPVGTLSLAFSDAGNGVLTYTYQGVTRSKSITRQAFASPPTACR
jgi:DNA-binding beta-propeller fold protein YncE